MVKPRGRREPPTGTERALDWIWHRRRWFWPIIGALALSAIAVALAFDSYGPLACVTFAIMAVLMLFTFFWQISVLANTGWPVGQGTWQSLIVTLVFIVAHFLAASGVLFGAFVGMGMFYAWLDITHVSGLPHNPGRDAAAMVIMGGLGAAVGIRALWLTGAWRIRQLWQLRNLPRSTAGAAAMGPVELHGRARPLALDGRPIEAELWRLPPFWLEDESGRIRIEPADVEVRRSVWWRAFSQRFCEATLSRRDAGDPDRRWLEDGDPVYVLGAVVPWPTARPEAADAARSVVRTWQDHVRPGLWARAAGAERSPRRFGRRQVFFLSDGTEEDARRALWKGLLQTLLLAAAWTGCSLVTVWIGLRVWD